ncbi:hypothetical protein RHGRI_014124 [Rhododendron griersonianum]|uniref:Uncharacterized protein n=1 Tax=Rhododendron griersonianum TaxID=479676 RepID=A0AAV6K883_9ERIC|nr:hypothetical protein RHGRI_014124 [Rhododendron griersonianum]
MDFTRGLKKIFKEDNIIKQTEVMGAMSEWWHDGYLRKNYDETYQGSSSDEGNDEEEVNDEDWSEEEDICPPRPTKKKKKSKGESKKKKKVPEVAGNRLFPGVVADDLETLKTYKWPAFVLDWLVNEIQNYKVRVTNKSGRKAEGVGGSLFLLMVIYFDLNPLDVEVGNEPEAPIGLWTKELIDIRISKEMEDMPIEDSVFSQFPPHNLKNQICIDMYKEYMHQFMNNSKFLHEMDAAMGEAVVGSPVVGSPQDGPWAEPVEDEGHSPQFSANFELHQYDKQGEEEEEEEEGDQIQEKGEGEGEEEEEEEEGDQIKETRDEIEEEGEVGGDIKHGSASSKRKQEEVAISTDPTKRKRRRNVKPSPSIKSPYVAQPFVKTTKLTEEEETIIKYLIKGLTNDLSEVLISIEGAKWPLTRKEVGESFRPRGLVPNMVMYTFTEWRMMKERAVATNGRPSRHIFAPAFASNLLAAQSDEFSTVLRDDCDPNKLGYDLLKCDMLCCSCSSCLVLYCAALLAAEMNSSSLISSCCYCIDVAGVVECSMLLFSAAISVQQLNSSVADDVCCTK